MGVDTGTHHVFAISRDRTACRATELSQFYSANSGGPGRAVDSVPCRLAGVTGAGVTLSCAGRNLLVPARVTRL
jgi:hypothetical protein